MKIQNLAIIFIIIILPISVILSAYIDNQMKTLNLQTDYDSKLYSATYDTIKAFQLNTINSSTSDLSNSKMRDLEAAANVFFSSIVNHFNMSGYNSDMLRDYVPALVFTLYDGYYIYSPYTNKLTDTEVSSWSKYKENEKITGLKPYIYYSCRYKKGEDIDVVITYSLDNYITIQGTINAGVAVNDSGYLLNDVTYDKGTGRVTYRGIEINKEAPLKEYIGNTSYTYVKINGVKHYKDSTGWFTILNGKKYREPGFTANESENDSAYNYYKQAALFKERVKGYGLTELKEDDAVDLVDINDEDGNIVHNFAGGNIFIFDDDNEPDIEENASNFNQHRLAVIRYSIERNLSIAIANYNSYAGGITSNFQMPRLKEDEWDKILNNVSLISFLQGLNIGGKIYNGYSIVTNNKTEEVVSEDSIYIIANGEYHRVTDRDLQSLSANQMIGEFSTSFERKSMDIENNGMIETRYYYPKIETGCYSSIVSQTGVEYTDNIYKYLENKPNLAKVYYTALGRERYSMFRVMPIKTE